MSSDVGTVTKPAVPKTQISASWHLASGAISGAASVLALQPLDLIKTRVQQDHSNYKSSPVWKPSVTDSISTPAAKKVPKTAPVTSKPTIVRQRAKIWSTATEVVKHDGVRGLWRGTIPTLYRNVPGVSLYFLTLSRLRTLIGQSGLFLGKGYDPMAGGKIKLTTAGDLIVGSTARTSVGFLLMPFTLVKTISESTLSLNQTSGKRVQLSTLNSLSVLYKAGGLKSLWRGAVPTALRDAPGAGLFIVFYERGRRLLGGIGEGGGGAVGGGMAGASASLLSTLLTTPFDLLKTRRQLSPDTYTSLHRSIAHVYATGGIKGFWEGGGLRVVRKAGSAGIGWAVYEAVLSFGERQEKDRLLSIHDETIAR